MTPSRRTFLTGLSASLIAAPAVVRFASLMPVRGIVQASPEDIYKLLAQRITDAQAIMRENINTMFYSNPEVVPVRFSGFLPAYEYQHVPWVTKIWFDESKLA